MFQVTDAACEHLSDVLAKSGAPDEMAVRLAIQEGSVVVNVDQARQDDKSFEHEERTVLVLSENVAQQLDGATLDVEPSDDGLKLALKSN